MTKVIENRSPEGPTYNEAGKLLGELLIYKGIVTPHQVKQALDMQTRSNAFLGQILVDLGSANAQTIGSHLASHFGVRYVDLQDLQPDPEAVALVPEEVVRTSQFIPFRLLGENLEVAMVDPLDVATIDKIHHLTGK